MAYFFNETMARNYATVSTGTGTGATGAPRTILLSFEQYEIVLAVAEDNRILGIVEVRQKKDFRNGKQKAASTGYFDMERFVTE